MREGREGEKEQGRKEMKAEKKKERKKEEPSSCLCEVPITKLLVKQSISTRQAGRQRSRMLALCAERNAAFLSPSCTSVGCLTHTGSCSCGTMCPQTLPRDGETRAAEPHQPQS